jgi:hypothetical protein
MHPIIRNIVAVVAGILLGSFVNMGIINISHVVVPPPNGVFDLGAGVVVPPPKGLLDPVDFLTGALPFFCAIKLVLLRETKANNTTIFNDNIFI